MYGLRPRDGLERGYCLFGMSKSFFGGTLELPEDDVDDF